MKAAADYGLRSSPHWTWTMMKAAMTWDDALLTHVDADFIQKISLVFHYTSEEKLRMTSNGFESWLKELEKHGWDCGDVKYRSTWCLVMI